MEPPWNAVTKPTVSVGGHFHAATATYHVWRLPLTEEHSYLQGADSPSMHWPGEDES